MANNVTIVKVISSEFDDVNQLFRRKLIGADGFGYQFVRPVSIDSQNQMIETAIAHDLRTWFHDVDVGQQTVIPFKPAYDPTKPVTWLPEIRVARPTRHYWLPDRLQVHTRVKTDRNETYNLFTPVQLVRDLIRALETHEVQTRAGAYADDGEVDQGLEQWAPNDPRPQ